MNDFADLSRKNAVQRFTKLGPKIRRRHYSEIPTGARRRIRRESPGQIGESFTFLQAVQQAAGLGLSADGDQTQTESFLRNRRCRNRQPNDERRYSDNR
jgi:hypothetical protein